MLEDGTMICSYLNTSVQDPSDIKNLRIFQMLMTRVFKDELVRGEVSDDCEGLVTTSSGMLGGEF